MEKNEVNLPRADRDLLISVSTKQDLMAVDIKEIKTDLISRIVKVEAEIDLIEKYHAGINLKRYTELADWVESFKANYKMIIFLGGFAVGIIGAVIEHFLNIWIKF